MKRLAILFALSALFVSCGHSNETAGPPPPAVTVTKAQQKEVTEWDEYTGRLAAVDEVDVRAQAPANSTANLLSRLRSRP